MIKYKICVFLVVEFTYSCHLHPYSTTPWASFKKSAIWGLFSTHDNITDCMDSIIKMWFFVVTRLYFWAKGFLFLSLSLSLLEQGFNLYDECNIWVIIHHSLLWIWIYLFFTFYCIIWNWMLDMARLSGCG